MNESSKATARRKLDWRFANRWFQGRGIDVGCGVDPLAKANWPGVSEVVPYDLILGNKDAQYLPEIADETFDFVHSSHTLEHLHDPRVALVNWLRVLKPGGFIVCTVPEEFYYECGLWPSRFNPDHKVSFALRPTPVLKSSVDIAHLLWKLSIDIELISLLTEGWDPAKFNLDQTLGSAECAIEFVVRKPSLKKLW